MACDEISDPIFPMLARFDALAFEFPLQDGMGFLTRGARDSLF